MEVFIREVLKKVKLKVKESFIMQMEQCMLDNSIKEKNMDKVYIHLLK
jgi:hypothetical protein